MGKIFSKTFSPSLEEELQTVDPAELSGRSELAEELLILKAKVSHPSFPRNQSLFWTDFRKKIEKIRGDKQRRRLLYRLLYPERGE